MLLLLLCPYDDVNGGCDWDAEDEEEAAVPWAFDQGSNLGCEKDSRVMGV